MPHFVEDLLEIQADQPGVLAYVIILTIVVREPELFIYQYVFVFKMFVDPEADDVLEDFTYG